MDVFGCFAVSNTVKQRKSKFLHNFILLKKGDDLHGQFVSIAERELAALWYCGLFGYLYVLISLFIVCFTYLPHILVSKVVYYINIQNFAQQETQYLGPPTADLPGRRSLRSDSTNRLLVPPLKLSTVGSQAFWLSAHRSGTICQRMWRLLSCYLHFIGSLKYTMSQN